MSDTVEITLPMPPSANHIWKVGTQRSGWNSGRARVYRSDEYKNWMHDALWIIGRQAAMTARVDVEIELCKSGRGDADNRVKAVLDALVKAGLLANDSKKYVRGIRTFWSDRDLGGDIVVRVSPLRLRDGVEIAKHAEGQRSERTGRLRD